MKKRILNLRDIAIIIVCLALVSGLHSCYRGSGDLITSERVVSSFNKVDAGDAFEIRFHFSQEQRVFVTTDHNRINDVTTEVNNNTLKLGLKNGGLFTKLLIDVYCSEVVAVSISDAGKFIANDSLIVSTFEAHVSDAGKIEGAFECETFYTTISNAGRINITGSATHLDLTISGAGHFRGKNFIVNNANVRISGAGNATVYVTDELEANISDAGTLIYYGNPSTVKPTVSGAGKINGI